MTVLRSRKVVSVVKNEQPHKPVENGDQIKPSTPAKEVESTNKSSHETTPTPHKLVQGSDKLGSVNRVDSGRKRKVANLGNGEAPGVINGSGSFTHTEIENESDVISVPDLGDKEETPTVKKVKSQRLLSRDVQFMGSKSVQQGDAGNKRLNLRSGKKLSKPGVNNVAKDKELSSSQDEKELEDGESETVFNGGEKTLRRFKTRVTTLTGLHFVTTTLMTIVLRWLGYIQPSHLPVADLLKFVLFANFSIVGMNVSLMWNSVGFYQVARKSGSTTGGVTKPHHYRPGTVALSEKLRRWFLVINAATLSKKRALVPIEKLVSSLIANSKLHGTLYGFIVFEVGWKDVRAINYLNELQALKEMSRATGSTNMNNQSRPMHEITFSTDDKPKLLTQLCPSRYLLIHSDVIIHGRPEFEPVSPTTDGSSDGLVPSTSPKQQSAQRPMHGITFSTYDKPKLLTQVIALNEKFPSPTLNVTTNYNVVVNVKKKLDESLLITWSGIEKRIASWQDGVLGTNCPIPAKWN
ncbi:hypothetical protein L2E82_40212 [Cichorium intybus]|uniref:Uncharacterized protein n=1 Tax=Cichorium intybus TaxID=13427 RepID=A0ACB9AJU4_CICIN|nr:hypothetical protein L2E82_40212 [Cichorium intybus]